MIQQELVPKLIRDKSGIFKGKGEAGTQQICMLMCCQRGGGKGEGEFKCLDDFKEESFTARSLWPSNSVCADLKKIDL